MSPGATTRTGGTIVADASPFAVAAAVAVLWRQKPLRAATRENRPDRSDCSRRDEVPAFVGSLCGVAGSDDAATSLCTDDALEPAADEPRRS